MAVRRPSRIAPAFALGLIALVVPPGTATAGHRHHRTGADCPPVGYAVPIQRVYQYPGTIAYQPTSPVGYAVPIQHVPQFPAVIVNQPRIIDPLAPPLPASPW